MSEESKVEDLQEKVTEADLEKIADKAVEEIEEKEDDTEITTETPVVETETPVVEDEAVVGKASPEEPTEEETKQIVEIVRDAIVTPAEAYDQAAREINILDTEPEPEPEPEPESMQIEAEQVKKFDKDLTDEKALNPAMRNVDNISQGKSSNKPVIAGPAGRRRMRNKEVPSRPMKSIPGKRSGVFEINSEKESNDSSRVTMNEGVHHPTSKTPGISTHGKHTGVQSTPKKKKK